MADTKAKPLFEVEGRPVFRGDLLHCPPHLFSRAGETVRAEFPEYGDGRVVVRSIPSQAVPTVRVSELSWNPHPETLILKAIEDAGFQRPTVRDVEVWQAAQRAAQAAQGGEHGAQ